MVQQLGLCVSPVGSVGSIPGQGTKIPHAQWCGQKKKSKRISNFIYLFVVLVQVLSLVWLFCPPVAVAWQVPWDFPDKNTGVGCHSLLQGLFLAQGSIWCFLHCRQILYQRATWEAHLLGLFLLKYN